MSLPGPNDSDVDVGLKSVFIRAVTIQTPGGVQKALIQHSPGSKGGR